MTPVQAAHIQFHTGNIVIKEQLPSLFIGRNLVATVLSNSKDGMVLVSMFGKRLLVETAMELTKGQVLNLKVQALHPKVVLKAVEGPHLPKLAAERALQEFVRETVGTFEKTPLKAFDVRTMLRDQVAGKPGDAQTVQFLTALLDEATQYPQALAFLLIPVVQDDSRGQAKVAIEKGADDSYLITFNLETDHMGTIGCTARIGGGVEVEIRTGSDAIADFLRSHLLELQETLSSLDVVRRLEVVVNRHMPTGVDALV